MTIHQDQCPLPSPHPQDEKSLVRQQVWTSLRSVALPDSRHHYDFSSFIPDFWGSDEAVTRLVDLEIYRSSKVLFITPDNCLEGLRLRALKDKKTILMTTYGIRRGFWILDPTEIPRDSYLLASTLDGMERFGRRVGLSEMAGALNPHASRSHSDGNDGNGDAQGGTVVLPLLVTGTGAINTFGVRFGKGHGFFDLEWSILFSLGLVDPLTSVTVAVVHDCQVLEDQELTPEEFDTVCDLVITPTRVIVVDHHVQQDGTNPERSRTKTQSKTMVQKPTCGILWDKLQPGMLDDIPPLQELKSMMLDKS
ncbi:hypothetical protein H2204_007447 [Knufia peltigerae]|uniref:5-formyltetrahydrofolate cyclo-ligase n=1 Tax=Knufia peltigerae TaxID=1002370 RepID=A0AA38Y225_9EURO|nr:hypothetical protein H2204_007447 [Knufia peltigerae]